MNLEIRYLKRADKFFAKHGTFFSKEKSKELIIKSLKKLLFREDVNVDVKRLKGDLEKFYRIRSGKVRILFELRDESIKILAIVNDIDFRGNIYK